MKENTSTKLNILWDNIVSIFIAVKNIKHYCGFHNDKCKVRIDEQEGMSQTICKITKKEIKEKK